MRGVRHHRIRMPTRQLLQQGDSVGSADMLQQHDRTNARVHFFLGFDGAFVRSDNRSISIVIGFIWSLNRHAQVIGLIFSQLSQLHPKLLQVQPSDLLI